MRAQSKPHHMCSSCWRRRRCAADECGMSASSEETTTSPDTMPKPAPWEAGRRQTGWSAGRRERERRPKIDDSQSRILHDETQLSAHPGPSPGSRPAAAHDVGVPSEGSGFRGSRSTSSSLRAKLWTRSWAKPQRPVAAAWRKQQLLSGVDTRVLQRPGRLPLEGRVRLVIPGRSVSDRAVAAQVIEQAALVCLEVCLTQTLHMRRPRFTVTKCD
jgi:hypothetical protein